MRKLSLRLINCTSAGFSCQHRGHLLVITCYYTCARFFQTRKHLSSKRDCNLFLEAHQTTNYENFKKRPEVESLSSLSSENINACAKVASNAQQQSSSYGLCILNSAKIDATHCNKFTRNSRRRVLSSNIRCQNEIEDDVALRKIIINLACNSRGEIIALQQKVEKKAKGYDTIKDYLPYFNRVTNLLVRVNSQIPFEASLSIVGIILQIKCT